MCLGLTYNILFPSEWIEDKIVQLEWKEMMITVTKKMETDGMSISSK